MKKTLLCLGIVLMMLTALTGCSKAGNYYREGKSSFISGDYKQAAEKFVMAIKDNPNRAEYYIDYGMTLIALQQYNDALIQFDRVYLDKNIKMIKENNKRVLRGKGITFYHMSRYAEALEHFELALSIDELTKLDVDILYYKGQTLMTIGRYQEAADTFTVLLSLEENNTSALSDRAYTYLMLGDYESSLLDYDRAILLKPSAFELYFGKYNLMLESRNTSGAEEVLKEASKIQVKSKEDKFNLAKVNYFQGNYDYSLATFSEAYTNGFGEAFFYIGEIYQKRKDYPTSVYYYELFLEEGAPENPAVYNQIATSLMKQGEYTQALKYLETGIAYNHSNYLKVMKKNEVIAYEELGMFESALEKLIEYRKAYPEDEEAAREEIFLRTRINDF